MKEGRVVRLTGFREGTGLEAGTIHGARDAGWSDPIRAIPEHGLGPAPVHLCATDSEKPR